MYKENMGERPSRSILKNDNTLPLLPSTHRLNRRVSFHPEVTLHKINFVPMQVDKRRETIAFIPLLSDTREPENSSAESANSTGSDDNINADDKAMERDSAHEDGLGDDSDDELPNLAEPLDEVEEETMDFTGPFDSKFLGSAQANDDGHSNAAINHDTTTYKEQHDSPRNEQYTEDNPADTDGLPQAEDGEGDMELTSNIGLNLQSIVNTLTSRVDDSIQHDLESMEPKKQEGSDVPHVNNESTETSGEPMHLTSVQPEPENAEQGLKTINDDDNDEDNDQPQQFENDIEETMEMTKLYPQSNVFLPSESKGNDHFNQEVTMEMTKIFYQSEGIEIQSEYTGQPSNDQKTTEFESIMEFTQELGKINISDKETTIDQIRSTESNDNENINQVGEGKAATATETDDSTPNINKIIEEPIYQQPEDTLKEVHDSTNDSDIKDQNEAILNSEAIHPSDTAYEHPDGINEINTNVVEPVQPSNNADHLINTEEEKTVEHNSEAQNDRKHEVVADNIEVIQPSQNMQLTQEYSEIKQVQPKRKSDEEIPEAHKYPKINGHNGINKTVTTTIPLADISTESIEDELDQDENYIPVSLNEFLKDIGIRFYDDLEIGIKSTDRLSVSFPNVTNSSEIKFEEYVAAMNKIPLLELYDFSCKELTKNIKDGKALFDQFDQVTKENNPKLFKQYYLSSPSEKLSLKSEFQLVKDYTRHQAKAVWYSWRSELIKNLISQLDDRYESLLQDKELLLKNLSVVESIDKQLKVKFNSLSNQLNQLLQIETHCKELNNNELLTLRDDLVVIRNKFNDNQQIQAHQAKELGRLNSAISDNKALIKVFNDEISDVEKSLSSKKKYKFSEIELLKLKFNFLQFLTGMNYKSTEGCKISFSYIGVDIAMDFTDINNLSNISYSVNESSPTFFHNSYLTSAIAPKLFNSILATNIVENFKAFKHSWSVLQSIDKDITAIAWKFPIVFIDSEENTIQFKVRYYSAKQDFKMELFVSIDMSDLQLYPNHLEVRGKLVRASQKVTQESVLSNFLEECVPNALINNSNNIFIDGL